MFSWIPFSLLSLVLGVQAQDGPVVSTNYGSVRGASLKLEDGNLHICAYLVIHIVTCTFCISCDTHCNVGAGN